MTSGNGKGRKGGYGKADGTALWNANNGRSARMIKENRVVRGTNV